MSVLTNNNISVKEYNKISKYKKLKIEIEKMWHFKTTTLSVIVEALHMIKKGTNKHTNKTPGSTWQYKIQNLHFVELHISLGECNQWDWKSNTQKKQKKHKYMEYVYLLHGFGKDPMNVRKKRKIELKIE